MFGGVNQETHHSHNRCSLELDKLVLPWQHHLFPTNLIEVGQNSAPQKVPSRILQQERTEQHLSAYYYVPLAMVINTACLNFKHIHVHVCKSSCTCDCTILENVLTIFLHIPDRCTIFLLNIQWDWEKIRNKLMLSKSIKSVCLKRCKMNSCWITVYILSHFQSVAMVSSWYWSPSITTQYIIF